MDSNSYNTFISCPTFSAKCKLSMNRFYGILYLLLFLGLSVSSAYAEIQEETINLQASTNLQLEAVPADQLFKPLGDYKILLSNDGAYIASMRLVDSKNHLLITDRVKQKVILQYDFGNSYPEKYNWKNNKLIVNSNKLLYEVSLDNSSPRLLLGSTEKRPGLKKRAYLHWKLLSAAPDSYEQIVIQGWQLYGNLNRAFHYNIFTGELTELSNINKGPKGAVWFYDNRGLLQGGIRKEKGIFEIYKPDGNKLSFSRKFKLSNPVSNLPVKDSYLSDRMHYEHFGPNNKIFSHNLDSDKYQLYKYDYKTKKYSAPIFKSDKYDVGGNIKGTYIIARKGKVFGYRYLADKPTVEWIDDKFISVQKKIDSLFPNGNNLISSYSDDVSVVVFNHDDGIRGKTYYYDYAADKLTLFVNSSKNLQDHPLPSRKTITYASIDGMPIEAYLSLPPGYNKTTPLPSIVMPHSSRRGRYNGLFSNWAYFFASRGYAVLQINHRGTQGYGRKHYLSGIKNAQKLLIDDIASAAKWLTNENYSSKNNIFLFGNGAGGHTALMASIKYPNTFKAVATISAPIDMVNEIKDYKKYDMDWSLEYYKVAVGEKLKKPNIMDISPYHKFDKINQPTLFIYGKNNTFISKKKLSKRIKNSDKPQDFFQLFFIDKESDVIKKNTNKIFSAEKISEFFASHTLKD